MKIRLKVFLYRTYCRTILNYGIENLHISERAYKEMHSFECLILKYALSISKTVNNTKLMNAINLPTVRNTVAIKKLKFFNQSLNNNLTNEFIINKLNSND